MGLTSQQSKPQHISLYTLKYDQKCLQEGRNVEVKRNQNTHARNNTLDTNNEESHESDTAEKQEESNGVTTTQATNQGGFSGSSGDDRWNWCHFRFGDLVGWFLVVVIFVSFGGMGGRGGTD